MKKHFSYPMLIIFVLLFVSSQVEAKSKIWQQANNPANSVGLQNLKDSEAEELALNHPYTLDPKKLTDMFLSIRYNKDLVFRKDLQDSQVFFDVDLFEKKFAPRIVEAFQKATPKQVVEVSIVQKDPLVIIRNDRLNVFKAFINQEGLHVQFIKTDAKLGGDYQKKGASGQRLVANSKSLGVTLEPQKGQKLSFNNGSEIILDLKYDFAALVDQKAAEDEKAEQEKKKRKKDESPAPRKEEKKISVIETQQTNTNEAVEDRLKKLQDLKNKKLITPEEYEAKRKEIIQKL